MIVMLHGAGRDGATLNDWRTHLPVPVSSPDLPGHGSAPALARQRISDFVDYFVARLPPRSFIVGESFGGTVALGLAAFGHTAIAFDPLLSTAKQLLVQQNMRALLSRQCDAHLAGFLDEVFGIKSDGRIEERNYWPLLDEAKGIVDIVAGSVSAWPPRVVDQAPCLLDVIDNYHLRRHSRVRFHQIEGPHLLLRDSVPASRDLILAAYERHQATI